MRGHCGELTPEGSAVSHGLKEAGCRDAVLMVEVRGSGYLQSLAEGSGVQVSRSDSKSYWLLSHVPTVETSLDVGIFAAASWSSKPSETRSLVPADLVASRSSTSIVYSGSNISRKYAAKDCDKGCRGVIRVRPPRHVPTM